MGETKETYGGSLDPLCSHGPNAEAAVAARSRLHGKNPAQRTRIQCQLFMGVMRRAATYEPFIALIVTLN